MPQETVRVLRLSEDASTVQCKKYSIRSYQAHYHRFYEIELIVSGSGTHLLNGTSYPLRPGLMYLLRPTDVHELIIDDTAKPLRVYEHAICTVRKQYLAHNDKHKENIYVNLNDLYAIMDEICIMLNAMCEKDVDTGVMPFSENTKNAIKKRCKQGLKNMIYHDDQPIAISIPLQDE